MHSSKIWQITILPSVVISLIVGVGSLDKDDAKKIATKAGLVLALFWAIGIGAFFSLQLAFPDIEKASFFSTQDLVGADDFNIIDLFIPSNPFRALSEGLIPAIVVFCLFLGFALMMDIESKPILNSLKIFLAALTRITGFLTKTFPIGVLIITAETTGNMTFEGLLELQVFLISLAASAVLMSVRCPAPLGYLLYDFQLSGYSFRIVQGSAPRILNRQRIHNPAIDH